MEERSKLRRRTSETTKSLSVSSFFFSSRRPHTRLQGDWSSDVCSSDLGRGDLLLSRHVDEDLAHKWVGFAFLTDSRGGPVSRQDGNVVSQRKQLRLNSLEQLLAVTAGKVPTTNAAGKQNIAANQKLR